MVLDLQSKLIFSCFFFFFKGSFLDETINKAVYNETVPFILAASVHVSQELERKILPTLLNSHNGLY